MPKHYLMLLAAVFAETVGTSAMQSSAQFTRLWPTLLMIVAYGFSFYMLGLSLKYFQVGVMYALWSGLGIVFIAIIGWLIYGQTLDGWAVLGMALILSGILVIHLMSDTSTHG